MKSLGLVRKVDRLGRITIPKRIREVCNIQKGDYLEICLNNQSEIIFVPWPNNSRVNKNNQAEVFRSNLINKFAEQKNINIEKIIEIIEHDFFLAFFIIY